LRVCSNTIKALVKSERSKAWIRQRREPSFSHTNTVAHDQTSPHWRQRQRHRAYYIEPTVVVAWPVIERSIELRGELVGARQVALIESLVVVDACLAVGGHVGVEPLLERLHHAPKLIVVRDLVLHASEIRALLLPHSVESEHEARRGH